MQALRINYQELTAGKLREALSTIADHQHISIQQVDNRGDIRISLSPWLDRKQSWEDDFDPEGDMSDEEWNL